MEAVFSDVGRKWDEKLFSISQKELQTKVLGPIKAYAKQYTYLPSFGNLDLPLRPPILTKAFHEKITEKCIKTISIAAKAFAEICKNNVDFFIEESGIHPSIRQILSENPIDKEYSQKFGRPDIIISNGEIKFIELNLDSALGGLVDCAIVPSLYINSEIGSGMSAANSIYAHSPIASISNFIVSYCNDYGINKVPNVGIIEFDFDVEVTTHLASLLSNVGIPAAYLNPDRCDFKGDGVFFESKKIDFLFKGYPFDALEFPGDEDLIEQYTQVVGSPNTVYFSDESSSILSSKMMFAIIWGHIQKFSVDEQDFIKHHLPWTAKLDLDKDVVFDNKMMPLRSVLTQKDRLVIKPSSSHGGKGVVIGKAVSNIEWEQAISDKTKSKGFIIQEYCEPDSTTLPFYENDRLVLRQVSYILGQNIINNQAAGCIFRYRKEFSHELMNHAKGSSVNVCLIGDE